MTIITYRAGIMAADSGCQHNEVHIGAVQKIWRLPNRYLYGACGQCWDQDVRAILSKKGIDATADELGAVGCELEALVVTTIGRVFKLSINQPASGSESEFFQVDYEYHAIGAGAELAIGAMAHGATAIEAVKCVAKHAPYVWLPVQHLTLGGGDGHDTQTRKRRSVR